MHFSKEIRKTHQMDGGGIQTTTTPCPVLFKDKESINHHNMEDYLANIWLLAAGEKEIHTSFPGGGLLLDIEFLRVGADHNPDHTQCTPLVQENGEVRETEKRICRCMNYFQKDPTLCSSCKSHRKWRNVGSNYHVIDYEVPTRQVVESVGGCDLLIKDLCGHIYATELKPEYSKETLVRMLAEILTYTAIDSTYQPAICFFKDSLQCADFCKEELQKDAAFQFLLSKVEVFYITYEEHDGYSNYVIHNNAEEPLV